MGWQSVSFLTDASHAEPICDALLEAGALSASIEDADAGTPDEKPQFGEPGSVNSPGWEHSRVVTLFDRTLQFALASNSESLGCIHFGASGNATLDGLRQTNLVVLREQGVLANVGEVETNEILFVAFNTFLCHCHTSGLRPGESAMGAAGV